MTEWEVEFDVLSVHDGRLKGTRKCKATSLYSALQLAFYDICQAVESLAEEASTTAVITSIRLVERKEQKRC